MVNYIQITLLTSEQFKQHSDIIPPTDKPWWLQNHWGVNSVYAVSSKNELIDIFTSYYCGVRPLVGITLIQERLINRGDKIRIGSKSFTILYKDGPITWVLCDECIAMEMFDERLIKSWEESHLKQWLETDGVKLIF